LLKWFYFQNEEKTMRQESSDLSDLENNPSEYSELSIESSSECDNEETHFPQFNAPVRVLRKRTYFIEEFAFRSGLSHLHQLAIAGQDDLLFTRLNAPVFQEHIFVRSTHPTLKYPIHSPQLSINQATLLERATKRDIHNKSVLDYAIERGCTKSVRCILTEMFIHEFGVTPSDAKIDPDHILLIAAHLENKHWFKHLLNHLRVMKINLNEKDQDGNTIVQLLSKTSLIAKPELDERIRILSDYIPKTDEEAKPTPETKQRRLSHF